MSLNPSASRDQRSWLILVVKDDWIVGLDLTGTLEEHGFELLGPAITVAAALLLLEGRRPDAAVLDVNLGRDLVTPVARRLCGHGVPFVLASGCTQADLGSDELLTAATNLGKPTSSTRLVVGVSKMVERTDGRGAWDQRRL